MLQKIRRVVTGLDEDGRSVFISDAPADCVFSPKGQPNVGLTDLWVADRTPAPLDSTDDPTDRPFHLTPKPGGTICRVVEFPPDKERNFETMQEYFADMQAADNLDQGGSRHPAFHKTDTVDYLFILKGEIWALMDEGEILLKEGDCLIQRGTNHAWSNRSDAPCLVIAVLVDAEPATA